MSKTHSDRRFDWSRLWSRDVLWAALLTLGAGAAVLLGLFSDGVRGTSGQPVNPSTQSPYKR